MLINGVKFACATCIKGHRASNCKHTDRPLFEIRKKGRPVTQCTFCRDLRKTKQLHIKCECNKTKNKEVYHHKKVDTIVINKMESSCTCQQQEPKLLSPSYRWALISPSENHCKLHFHQQDLGYVFRKKSVDKNRNQPSPISPSSSSTLSSPSTSTSLLKNHLLSTPMLIPTENNNNHSFLEKDMLQELDDDLCNLLDSMIEKESSSSPTNSLPSSPLPFPTPNSSSSLHSPTMTLNQQSSTSFSFDNPCQKALQWFPNPPPPDQKGESVIITMTPLPKWDQLDHSSLHQHHQPQQHTISTTRLVTCYCGSSCKCPGCLVHPTSSLFASQGLDPYIGYPSFQSASSSDED